MGWAIGRDELGTIKKTMKFSRGLSRAFGSWWAAVSVFPALFL